jgi:hypothetical protein
VAKRSPSKLFVFGPAPDYGRQVPVPVKSVSGGPLVVRLQDGTRLEITTLVVDVKRSLNRHSADGSPIYAVGAAQVIKAKVPSKLRVRR